MQNREIAVDLDGTLVNSDLLVENLFLFLRLYPLRVFEVLLWLFKGKAYFKRRLAETVMPDASRLPYNTDLLHWLAEQKSKGARLILATASHTRIANSIAKHLGIFEATYGTEDVNLSSENKRKMLVDRCGENGYEYVGNSTADLAVWRNASVIHIVNPERGVLAAARKLGPQVGKVFQNRPTYFRTLLKALRVHQWAKNFLLFVPLLASHEVTDVALLLNGLLAFAAFGACASSVYLLNDLLDLPDDRQHPTKCKRPLAAGTLPILHALVLIPGLLFVAFYVALAWLPIRFAIVLLAYYVLTLAYSLWLKRIVMVDVVILAMLYTVRVIAGTAALMLETTFWILAFCVFIFLSLAFVKRYTELQGIKQTGKKKAAGRGYYPEDFELLASLGGASGYISVLVLALYINDAAFGTLYRSPEWMWAACPLLLFWLSRVWLLAHRGQMHDDPIVFALRDGVSRIIGAAFITVFVLATL